jgi:hypothetical protein
MKHVISHSTTNDEYTSNMDTIHEKKCGKAGTSRRQPAPFIQRIRVTHRKALFYTRTLSSLASVAPSKLSNRLACLQLQCQNTPHNNSSSARQCLTQRISHTAPRRKTCERVQCRFRRRHWEASSQSTNLRLGEGRASKWRCWQRRVTEEHCAKLATAHMEYIVERWHAKQIT